MLQINFVTETCAKKASKARSSNQKSLVGILKVPEAEFVPDRQSDSNFDWGRELMLNLRIRKRNDQVHDYP